MVYRRLSYVDARVSSHHSRSVVFDLSNIPTNQLTHLKGFDLIGSEDDLRPLVDYIGPLLRFQERQKELGLDIPFMFHAGETLGDGTKADDNLYDALLLGTRRIGHG